MNKYILGLSPEGNRRKKRFTVEGTKKGTKERRTSVEVKVKRRNFPFHHMSKFSYRVSFVFSYYLTFPPVLNSFNVAVFDVDILSFLFFLSSITLC